MSGQRPGDQNLAAQGAGGASHVQAFAAGPQLRRGGSMHQARRQPGNVEHAINGSVGRYGEEQRVTCRSISEYLLPLQIRAAEHSLRSHREGGAGELTLQDDGQRYPSASVVFHRQPAIESYIWSP